MVKEVETTNQAPKSKKFRLIEIEVDSGLTVIRRLVPEDIEEDDLPEGAQLFSTEETQIMLRRQGKPVRILRGHQVRLRPIAGSDPNIPATLGNVDTVLKTGKFRVKWDNGSVSRHDSSELERVY